MPETKCTHVHLQCICLDKKNLNKKETNMISSSCDDDSAK